MDSLKVPFESLSHHFRLHQKHLQRELSSLLHLHLHTHTHTSLPPHHTPHTHSHSHASSDMLSPMDDGDSPQPPPPLLEQSLEKIHELLNIHALADSMEQTTLQRMISREKEYTNSTILSTNTSTSTGADASNKQVKAAMKQLSEERKSLVLIGELLLRRGMFDAVEALVLEAGAGDWLAEHLDIDIFKYASRVEKSILQGDMSLPLQWCQDHASKLRRIGSALEFFVRQEQFLEMVYANRTLEALQFAQEHLAPLVMEKSPAAENSSADGPLPPPTNLRARAVSLGSDISSSNRRVSWRAGDRNSATATSHHPAGGGNSHHHSSSLFSFPFSFAADPLSFFRYATGITTSTSSSASSTQQNSRRERSQSDLALDASSLATEENLADHALYTREAMCHLMSMLAFVPPASTHAAESKVSSSTPFGSVVPHLYEAKYTSHRLRCMLDLFKMEFRRVYGLPRSCSLERQMQLGLLCLKTSSCLPHIHETGSRQATDCKTSPPNNSPSSTGGNGNVSISGAGVVYNAFRRLQLLGATSTSSSTSTSRQGGGNHHVNESHGSESSSAGNTPTDSRSPLSLPLPQPPGRSSSNDSQGGMPPSLSNWLSSGLSASRDSRDREASYSMSISGSNDNNDTASCTNGRHRQGAKEDCPVCSKSCAPLVKHLATVTRVSTRLKCRGSGLLMDHDNPPLALPNGQVYSKKFIYSQAVHASQLHSPPTNTSISMFDDLVEPTMVAESKTPAPSRESRERKTAANANANGGKKERKEGGRERSASSSGEVLYFTCPITNQTYDVELLKPVFII